MGKGSFPRNNTSKEFFSNFDEIKFKKGKDTPEQKKSSKRIKKTYIYKS